MRDPDKYTWLPRDPPRIPRDEYRPEFVVIWGMGAIVTALLIAAVCIWLR